MTSLNASINLPYQRFVEAREASAQRRFLKDMEILPGGRAQRDGRVLINFSGNDYLGLSHHPALKTRAADYAARYGTGSTASRLVCGNHPLYARLEEKLAAMKGTEAALILGSGYQTNLSVLAALAADDVHDKSVVILVDRLAHNSLLQGAQLSGARFQRFQHNDDDHLGRLLEQHGAAGTSCIVVSESVFSMDGDCADIAALSTLSRKHNALFYLDEAHATGVFGPSGFGLAAGHKGEVDVVMGTFGKALGSFGAYVACSRSVRDYLIQRCGGLIYSTALPPPVLGAIEAALELLPELDTARAQVLHLAATLREGLRAQGWLLGASTTPIIPLLLGDESAALNLAEKLEERGFLVPAIRPPTVPRGTSRLRFSLSAAHGTEDITALLDVMAEMNP